MTSAKSATAIATRNFSIHRLDTSGLSCSICGSVIPLGHKAKPGEYVGVSIYKTIPNSAYRIGENNKDSLCDGTTADKFTQTSIK